MTVLNFPASPAVNDTYTENNVTYTWNGNYWEANNTGSLDDIYVEVAGDVMTGNLQLPGGGGNTAALQKQEITDLPVSTFDNDSGYITSSDIPPGTVSYWKKEGSDLKPVSATDNIDIGGAGLIYGQLQVGPDENSGAYVGSKDAFEITPTSNGLSGTRLFPDSFSVSRAADGVIFQGRTITYIPDGSNDFTSVIYGDGSSEFAGNMAIGGIPSVPNIELRADGQTVWKAGPNAPITLQNRIGTDDDSYIYGFSAAGLASYIVNRDGTTAIGGSLWPTGDSRRNPNIELKASDGSITAAGGVSSDRFTSKTDTAFSLVRKSDTGNGYLRLAPIDDSQGDEKAINITDQGGGISKISLNYNGKAYFMDLVTIYAGGDIQKPAGAVLSLKHTLPVNDNYPQGFTLGGVSEGRDTDGYNTRAYFALNSSIRNGSPVELLTLDHAGNAWFKGGIECNSPVQALKAYRNTTSSSSHIADFYSDVGGTKTSVCSIRANGTVLSAGSVLTRNVELRLEADDPTKYTTDVDEEGEETLVYNGAVLDVKESIETAVAARAAMRETFQELLVAVQSATDFGELKSAMLVALEDYA